LDALRDLSSGDGGVTKSDTTTVRAWEEAIIIPTYPEQLPDKNPMFFEKRVYQGSSGKV